MRSGYGLTNTVGDLTHHHALTTNSCNQVNLITTIKQRLHQRNRHGDLLFSPSVK